MKRIQQIISCYLTLCLAGGSMVAVSPLLHHLVEHGGQGAAHAHLGVATRPTSVAHAHSHDHGLDHSHYHGPSDDTNRSRSAGLFKHSYEPFGWPAISLSPLWQRLAHLIDGVIPSEPSPSHDGPGHEHHSFFQLMASGLIDQPLDTPGLPEVTPEFPSQGFRSISVVVSRDWDAQTASRGPPPAQG